MSPSTGCSPTSKNPPGTSTLPFFGSTARTVTSALSPSTMAAPTEGAELRYQDRLHSGHLTLPLGRGFPKGVSSAGQKRKGSVGEKGTSLWSSITGGLLRAFRRRRRADPRRGSPPPSPTARRRRSRASYAEPGVGFPSCPSHPSGEASPAPAFALQ